MRARRYGLWLVVAIALVALAQRLVRVDVERRLARARTAPTTVSYSGRQRLRLANCGQLVEAAVEVHHRAPDLTRWEYRGGAVNGLTVIQRGEQVSRWLAGGTSAVANLSLAEPGGTVSTAGYRAREGRGGTVAGRPSRYVVLEREGERREYWLDRETGLVLRSRNSRHGALVSETEFEWLTLGDPPATVSFEPPPAAETVAQSLSLDQLSAKIGATVQEPRYLPGGFELATARLYDCPCGCGMVAAQLVYGNGLRLISVFEQAPCEHGCVVSDACCNLAEAAGACITPDGSELPVVARVDRTPQVIVVGSGSTADLARIADSVPAQPLKR